MEVFNQPTVLSLSRSLHQSKLATIIGRLLSEGVVLVACPLLTPPGIKTIDVAWLAPGRTELETGELVTIQKRNLH
jgi:hypothetical protein